MRKVHTRISFLAVAGVAMFCGCSVTEPSDGESTPAVAVPIEPFPGEPGVKPLEHQASPLPENPPIRFRKLYSLAADRPPRIIALLAFSPDGKILAASREEDQYPHDVTLWDVQKRRLLHVLPHPDEERDPIGAMAFLPPGDRVVANTAEAQPTITLSTFVPAGAAYFTNLDDDDIAHNVTAADMVPQAQLWREVFRPACIEVDLDKHNLAPNVANVNQTDVPFRLYVSYAEFGTQQYWDDWAATIRNPATGAWYSQAQCDNDFWVVYQLGAFQDNIFDDYDPDGGAYSLFGRRRASTNQSFLFAETMVDALATTRADRRCDYATLRQIVSVHETAHCFAGVWDGPQWGTLMAGGQYGMPTDVALQNITLSPLALRCVISTTYPGEEPWVWPH